MIVKKYWQMLILLFIPVYYLERAISLIGISEFEISGTNATAVLTIIVSFFGIQSSLLTSRSSLLCALFWYFNLIFFGITQLLIINDSQAYYLNHLYVNPDYQYASNLVLISSLLFLAGQWLGNVKYQNREFESIKLNQKLFVKKIRIAFYLYIIFMPLIIAMLGGFSYLFKFSRNDEIPFSADSSVYNILQSVLYVCPVVFLVIDRWYRNKFHVPCLNNFKANSLLILIILLSNPFGQSRQLTIFLIFPILYIYLIKRETLRIAFFAFLPILMLTTNESINRDTGKFSGFKFVLTSRHGDFDAFSQLMNSINAIKLGAFPIFHQIQGSLFFFLPRTYFQSKPKDSGAVIGETFSLGFRNLSAPWQSELLVNFRLIGLIAGAFIFGFMLMKTEKNLQIDSISSIYSAITFGCLFILLRGSLLQATGRIVFSFILIFLLTSFHLQRSKKLRI